MLRWRAYLLITLRQALLEAFLVHAAVAGRDAVRVGVDALVVAGVPLQGDLRPPGPVSAWTKGGHLPEKRFLGSVEVLHVIDDPTGVAVGLLGLALRPFVFEADLEALVEKGHHLQAFEHGLGPELGFFEDGGIRPEGDQRARPAPGRGPDHLQRALGPAPVGELDPVPVAAPVDLEDEPGRQGVHDRHADSVQATGHLVADPPNLPPACRTVSTTSAAVLSG